MRIILGHDWECPLYRDCETRGEGIWGFVLKIGWQGVRRAGSAVDRCAGGPSSVGRGSAWLRGWIHLREDGGK